MESLSIAATRTDTDNSPGTRSFGVVFLTEKFEDVHQKMF